MESFLRFTEERYLAWFTIITVCSSLTQSGSKKSEQQMGKRKIGVELSHGMGLWELAHKYMHTHVRVYLH